MAQASVEKLEHTGLAEKERVASVPQGEQLASTTEPPLPKRKIKRAISPDHQIMRRENQGEREPHSGERAGIREGTKRGKGGLHSEGRFQEERRRVSKESLPRRSRTNHERVSGRI